jgi:carboxyl-terminal processing protease
MLLASCAPNGGSQPGLTQSSSALRDVLATAFEDISQVYIDQRDFPTLATSGLNGLKSLDADLAGDYQAGQLTVRRGTEIIASAQVDSDASAGAWASALSDVVTGAKQRSGHLSQVSDDVLKDVLFSGITASLDSSSRYTSPVKAEANRQLREGTSVIGRVALGAAFIAGRWQVTSIGDCSAQVQDAPRRGDIIVAIDGRPVAESAELDLGEALEGPVASPVTVTFKRGLAGQSFTRTLTRSSGARHTVGSRRIGKLFYVQICSIDAATGGYFRDAIDHVEARENVEGYVLDLRGNSGGLLLQAVAIADDFLSDGKIADTKGRHPDSAQHFAANPGDVTVNKPIVVLIDGGTAAGAEMIAAALQANGRAVLVGSPSYGRGSIQTLLPLPDQGEIVLTWARLTTPDGYDLDSGVLPSICTSAAVGRDWKAEVAQSPSSKEFPIVGRRGVAPGDKAALHALHDGCSSATPPTGDPDLDIAQQLLADPALYQRILGLGAASAP